MGGNGKKKKGVTRSPPSFQRHCAGTALEGKPTFRKTVLRRCTCGGYSRQFLAMKWGEKRADFFLFFESAQRIVITAAPHRCYMSRSTRRIAHESVCRPTCCIAASRYNGSGPARLFHVGATESESCSLRILSTKHEFASHFTPFFAHLGHSSSAKETLINVFLPRLDHIIAGGCGAYINVSKRQQNSGERETNNIERHEIYPSSFVPESQEAHATSRERQRGIIGHKHHSRQLVKLPAQMGKQKRKNRTEKKKRIIAVEPVVPATHT